MSARGQFLYNIYTESCEKNDMEFELWEELSPFQQTVWHDMAESVWADDPKIGMPIRKKDFGPVSEHTID